MPKSRILHGDCLKRLKSLPANSVDSLVTDPPAGISFMGKDWDHHKGGRTEWIAWMRDVMAECLRVLKPGAHGLVWALPRTSHWTGTALEEAGFEVRDTVLHCFGSGFPKSLDVSKAIDKAAGAERKIIGRDMSAYRANAIKNNRQNSIHAGFKPEGSGLVTAPATPDAQRWQGFGTALKPAVEIWWLVRKPLSEKTVARNVLKHGVGALNIDASRIETQDRLQSGRHIQANRTYPSGYKDTNRTEFEQNPQGRWPANLLLSCCGHDPHLQDCAVAELDRQSGTLKSGVPGVRRKAWSGYAKRGIKPLERESGFADSGGASRFFYVAKPSKRERNAGCEGLQKRRIAGDISLRSKGVHGQTGKPNKPIISQNHHPTVKPLKLMRYLITMITPPGGICLDPFLGSGTTAVAAKQAGFRFIGIEREREYVKICRARVRAVKAPLAAKPVKRQRVAARPLQEVSA